jgi:hypothetical protein
MPIAARIKSTIAALPIHMTRISFFSVSGSVRLAMTFLLLGSTTGMVRVLAVAVASSFGAAGLGTDTGNSIRGPSSHTSLVGIRSTMGLTSRDGIVPRQLHRDIGGPIARTVADAAAIFDVIAGPDPADPVTSSAQGKRPDSYLTSLDKNGSRGRGSASCVSS